MSRCSLFSSNLAIRFDTTKGCVTHLLRLNQTSIYHSSSSRWEPLLCFFQPIPSNPSGSSSHLIQAYNHFCIADSPWEFLLRLYTMDNSKVSPQDQNIFREILDCCSSIRIIYDLDKLKFLPNMVESSTSWSLFVLHYYIYQAGMNPILGRN
jgi:hypothetical protein